MTTASGHRTVVLAMLGAALSLSAVSATPPYESARRPPSYDRSRRRRPGRSRRGAVGRDAVSGDAAHRGSPAPAPWTQRSSGWIAGRGRRRAVLSAGSAIWSGWRCLVLLHRGRRHEHRRAAHVAARARGHPNCVGDGHRASRRDVAPRDRGGAGDLDRPSGRRGRCHRQGSGHGVSWTTPLPDRLRDERRRPGRECTDAPFSSCATRRPRTTSARSA